MKKQITNWCLTIFSITALTVSAALFYNITFAETNQGQPLAIESAPLEPVVLQGLPEDAQFLNAYEQTKEDTSHPLGLGVSSDGAVRSAEANRSPLYAYQSAQNSTYLLSSGLISLYTYHYNTPQEVTAANALYLEGFGTEIEGVNYIEVTDNTKAVSFTGSEGDTIYWYSVESGSSLQILMGNGIQSAELESAFIDTAQELNSEQVPTDIALSDVTVFSSQTNIYLVYTLIVALIGTITSFMLRLYWKNSA